MSTPHAHLMQHNATANNHNSHHAAHVTTAAASLHCKPMDNGNTTRACAKYCNAAFRHVHCPFCSCSACAFCSLPAPPPPPRPPPSPPPPSPSPPAPPSPLELIQKWWLHGKPSSDIKSSGVLVRQFDALSKVRRFEPCPEDMWCGKYRFIWPSSIVNKNHNTNIYRGDNEAGLVLAPSHNRFFCVYPGDGNSMGHYDDNHGCQEPCQGKQVWDCAYEKDRLEEALIENSGNTKYNEVVVDAQYMKQNLPHSLMAVFYMNPDTREKAQEAHGEFLSTYKMTNAQFPLLHFSMSQGFTHAT